MHAGIQRSALLLYVLNTTDRMKRFGGLLNTMYRI